MTDAEIWKRVLRKTAKNGYKNKWSDYMIEAYLVLDKAEQYAILFDPQFAIGLWGEELVCDFCGAKWRSHCGHEWSIEKWQYHQHQLLDEIQAGRNPLLYIKRYLNRKEK